MKKIYLIIVIISFFTEKSLWAQQDMLLSRYMFDGITINPAYAGSHEALSATLLVRERWADIEGAPSTTMFSVHSPLGQSIAGGFLVIRDKLGISERLGYHAMGVYRIALKKETDNTKQKTTLAFGIQVGTINSRYNFESLEAKDPFDVVLADGNLNASTFTFGAGTYLYTTKWYIGLSAPRISLSTFGLGAEVAVDDAAQNILLNAGYVFGLTNFLKIKPNFLLRIQEATPTRYNLNLNLLLKNRIWIGGSYRSQDSINLLAQLQITPQLQFAYAYDAYAFSERNNFTVGSHEFSVNYRLSFFKKKVIEPSLF